MANTPQHANGRSGLTPLIGAAAALAIAAGVWVLPLDWLAPDGAGVSSRPRPVGAGDDVDSTAWMPVPDNPWTELVEPLERLRTKPEPVVVDDSEEDEDVPPPVARPTTPKPNWTYEGFISQPNGMVAMVRIGGVQRFIYPRQVVREDSVGGGPSYRVDTISERALVIRPTDASADAEPWVFELQVRVPAISLSSANAEGGDEEAELDPREARRRELMRRRQEGNR